VGVTPEPSVRGRINLAAVEAGLRRVQQFLGRPADRDPLDDRVVENLLAGYAYVDGLVVAGVDPFALGNLKHLLELNCLVLCGTREERRAAYAGHLEASERRFYGDGVAGIRDVVEWVAGHSDAPAGELAAGVYAMMLARPQLYIEGNHRTGVLAMSYVLARAGRPPFLLTRENAGPYFEISAALRDAAKHSPATRFRLSALIARLAGLLADDADRRHLIA
jgi:hypothetical protein